MTRNSQLLVMAACLVTLWLPSVAISQTKQPLSSDELRLQLAKCELERSTLEHRNQDLQRRLDAVADEGRIPADAKGVEKELQQAKAEVIRLRRQAQELKLANDTLREELSQLRGQNTPQPHASPSAVPITDQPQIPTRSQWRVCEETTIDGTVNQIERGTLFKTVTGNVYQVTDVVLDLVLELNPVVTVITDGHSYKLIIDGVAEVLECSGPTNPPSGTGEAVSSKVEDAFEGFELGKLFKLRNGQVWEQTSAKYRYRYKFAPQVWIWRGASGYKMRVEGLDDTVNVNRVR